MSAAIRAFSYDEPRNELTITFSSGKVYVYSLVPPAVATAFAGTASKGVFHNALIRDRYPFRKGRAAATMPQAGTSLLETLKRSRENNP